MKLKFHQLIEFCSHAGDVGASDVIFSLCRCRGWSPNKTEKEKPPALSPAVLCLLIIFSWAGKTSRWKFSLQGQQQEKIPFWTLGTQWKTTKGKCTQALAVPYVTQSVLGGWFRSSGHWFWPLSQPECQEAGPVQKGSFGTSTCKESESQKTNLWRKVFMRGAQQWLTNKTTKA